MATRSALLALIFMIFLGTAQGNAFRGNLRAALMSNMSAEHIRDTMLKEVMAALGEGNRVTEQRLAAIEGALKPTFVAMPKNEHGNLDDESARYVLHRLFVQRHGMYIRGLDPGMISTGDERTTEVLEAHIPSFVLGLFQDDKGLGMHKLAMLAATLEHLIHDEAVGRLEIVYQAHNMALDARVSELELQNIIDTYMTVFITGKQNITPGEVAVERAAVFQSYPGWHDTRKFTMQVRSGVMASKAAEPDFATDALTFRAASQIVEEIGERYGRWQDSECRDLKDSLTKMEHGSTGQVFLRDFYGSALREGNWQFSESVEYLREIGALEESDPQHMALIIPNYVNALSNCVASSSIFSVCCIDECEALMGHLERQIAAPEASASQILEIVAQLPSATVPAPRELQAELRQRLEEVESHHGGFVPLHGRLFMQWLHHAYPRECSFPNAPGANASATQVSMEERGQVTATREEMLQHVSGAETSPLSAQPAPAQRKELPWTPEEKLLARPMQKPARPSSWIRTVVMVVAATSFFIAVVRMVMDSVSAGSGDKARHGSLLPYVQKQHAC